MDRRPFDPDHTQGLNRETVRKTFRFDMICRISVGEFRTRCQNSGGVRFQWIHALKTSRNNPP